MTDEEEDPGMAVTRTRRRWYLLSAAIAVLGAALIVATIVWKWRHVPYGLGIAALVIGCVVLLAVAIRRLVWKVVASAVVVALLVGGGVFAITGIPQESPPQWDHHDADVSGFSARMGDLLISDGTAYNVESGEVVWSLDGESGKSHPMLVRSDIVVFDTRDGAVAVETSTGDELWRSPIDGSGVAASGNVLVVAHPVADAEPETVALDLTTGETVWQNPGEPAMECDHEPIVRFSVAPEQSHVLIVGDRYQAQLLSVADGSITIADVDCSVTARMVGDVLIEANGKNLLGRSAADGQQLWSTRIDESWSVEGAGSTVFTTSERAGDDAIELTAIDVATGRARTVEPPAGTVRYLSSIERYRSADVWVIVDLDHGAALWNPSTDAFVEIPDAHSISDYSVDSYSGWVAISGRTRDVTGDVTPQCWALSPSGQLFGPVPGPGCYVDEGILAAGVSIYPLD
jgi:hypothetical protein